jgi:hypothetical protein
MEIPDGFEEIDAKVYRSGDVVLVVAESLPAPIAIQLATATEVFEPPDGFEWTGEVRPPKKGEWFWSDLKGTAVQAIMDETGVNQFGEPTGGRKILRPIPKPERPRFRIVKDEE